MKLKNTLTQLIRTPDISLVGIVLFFLICLSVSTTVDAEEIPAQSYAAFSTKALLLRNGDLSVNEQFIFDYALSPKRGILRTIPLVLDEHGRHFSVHSISVTDKVATPYPYEFSSGGNTATIKIGDPKKMLTGTHYYDVKYTLKNLAGESELKWMIASAVKEPIKKFQADIYFPIPVPEQTATATCAFEPIGGECIAFPLSKSGLTAGYRISSDTVKGQNIIITMKYPLNLIVPEQQKNNAIPFRWIFLSILAALFLFLIFLLWRKYDLRLRALITSATNESYASEQYSYLVRAFALKNDISREDVVATIADLIQREYLTAHEASEGDYLVARASEDLPPGAEEYLCTLFTEQDTSLKQWIVYEYPQHKNVLVKHILFELNGVTLSNHDEYIPTLKNFEIPKEQG